MRSVVVGEGVRGWWVRGCGWVRGWWVRGWGWVGERVVVGERVWWVRKVRGGGKGQVG